MNYCGSLCVVCKVGTLLLTATPAGAEAERGDSYRIIYIQNSFLQPENILFKCPTAVRKVKISHQNVRSTTER